MGTCRVCGQGSLGVRICGNDVHPPLVLCEECESIWESPDCEETPRSTRQPYSNCPLCNHPIFDAPSRWANEEEIRQLGWGDHVVGMAYEEPAA